ncbi:MAG: tyrosine-type recombinase/integrase [Theionarchaea archaeon]|nr:tyrosine-type recombinase/integrase [Theionarchaea archaeon]
MLYDYNYRLASVEKRVKGLKERDNPELILKFLEKLFSEGISRPRVVKYADHLKKMSERMGKSFLEVDEEDITRFLSNLEKSDFSEHTKKDYRVVLRRFFRYLGRDELVKDVSIALRKRRTKLPGEILTKSEIENLIEAADHPRNKAMIGLLYEGGLRIGELASLKMKSVEFDDNGAAIRVRGKTGERRVRIVSFASTLSNWMEMHPRRADPEAPLWINLSTNYKKEGIRYEGIAQNVKRIAKKAGIKKKINLHLFRHSRATHLAKELTEAEMNVYFGWVQGSDMPGTYVHLSGRDVDDKILQIHGLKPRNKEGKEKLKPQVCPRCKYINSPLSSYCGRCGTVLDEKERMKLEMESRELTKGFPDLGVEDIGVLEEMKKFRDMLELLEKHPELLKKMRAMVEET